MNSLTKHQKEKAHPTRTFYNRRRAEIFNLKDLYLWDVGMDTNIYCF